VVRLANALARPVACASCGESGEDGRRVHDGDAGRRASKSASSPQYQRDDGILYVRLCRRLTAELLKEALIVSDEMAKGAQDDHCECQIDDGSGARNSVSDDLQERILLPESGSGRLIFLVSLCEAAVQNAFFSKISCNLRPAKHIPA
jgi:hypothetical protein